jgi:hypothetical protein
MQANHELLSKIEKIEQVELSSVFGQLKNAYKKIKELEGDIDNLYEVLKTKVNLESQVNEKEFSKLYFGEGTVSIAATAKNVVGNGTSFSRRFSIGGKIKIGSFTGTVIKIDSDTAMLLDEACPISYENSIYALVVPRMFDELTGYYRFGGAQGKNFRGVVAEGSVLEHYGRVAMPNDVATVRAVQKYVQPAMTLAQNSIRRSGDTVGNVDSAEDERLNFNFFGSNINIGNLDGADGSISWAFMGYARPDSTGDDAEKSKALLEKQKSYLVNKKYVDNFISDVRESLLMSIVPITATWDHTMKQNVNYLAGIAPSSGTMDSLDEYTYKRFFDSSLKCIRRCIVLVNTSITAKKGNYINNYSIHGQAELELIVGIGKTQEDTALKNVGLGTDGGWASDQHHSKKKLFASADCCIVVEKGDYLIIKGRVEYHSIEGSYTARASLVIWDAPEPVKENFNVQGR